MKTEERMAEKREKGGLGNAGSRKSSCREGPGAFCGTERSSVCLRPPQREARHIIALNVVKKNYYIQM